MPIFLINCVSLCYYDCIIKPEWYLSCSYPALLWTEISDFSPEICWRHPSQLGVTGQGSLVFTPSILLNCSQTLVFFKFLMFLLLDVIVLIPQIQTVFHEDSCFIMFQYLIDHTHQIKTYK